MNLFRSFFIFFVLAWASNSNAESAQDKSKSSAPEPFSITVYRSPTCGCCAIWLEYLKKNNFVVTDIKTTDVNSMKMKYGVSPRMTSCHTAVADGYVVEGHVPVKDIRKMLTEKPDIVGISVPGMPHGTPGMEMSGRKDPYSVISFDKDGSQQNYSDYLFY